MKENVLSLTVVPAGGIGVKTWQRPRNSAAGYDPTCLFIGFEGTLGIVTEITLKLHPWHVMEVVADMIPFVQLEAVFTVGSRLVTVHQPIR